MHVRSNFLFTLFSFKHFLSQNLLTYNSRIYDLLVSVESHITDEDLERDLLKALKDPSKSCYLNVVCQLIVCEDRLNAHYNREVSTLGA